MAKTKFAPRGMRNNNPLNIRRGKTPWVGEVQYIERVATDKCGNECKVREYDRTFCQFAELKYGWRAAFYLLRKYIEKYKCNTIALIINRWAPPSENNTANYIALVCRYAGISRSEEVDFADYHVMRGIVEGMCVAENGAEYLITNKVEWIVACSAGYHMAATCKM